MKKNKTFELAAKKLKSFYEFALDLIFPKFCVGCQREGYWICPDCVSKIIYIKSPTCPKCNRMSKNGRTCIKCKKESSLTGVIVAAYYNEGPLKEAIHTFKYNHVFDLKEDLGKILSEVIRNRWKMEAILLPVPIHKKRQNERGFNQSELLAKVVSRKIGYKNILNKLVRIKYTIPQVELSGKKRRENIKNAFAWKGKNEIHGKMVLLIDDVYTTGATLEECALVLKNAGAREVWALVLAKV